MPSGPFVRGEHLEVTESDQGLVIRQGDPPRVHQLNSTAALVFEMAVGAAGVDRIAATMRREFGLGELPVAEVSGCIDELLSLGILADANPFRIFDRIFCLNLDSAVERWLEAAHRHEQLDIAGQVERFSAVATPENHHRGNAMSFRNVIAESRRRRYEQVLILEDDAVFLDESLAVMRAVTAELGALKWDLFYLGACVWGQDFPYVDGSTVLKECGPVTCTHAIAVHSRAFERLLDGVPPAGADFERWLRDHLAVDQYLSQAIASGELRALISSPRIASQPFLLGWECADLALASRYLVRRGPNAIATARVNPPPPVDPPASGRPRVCVGMATYGDFDGVWFTIQSIRMYQGDVLDDLSFVVIDNHPEGATAPALRALGDWIPDYRYVPFGGYQGTAVRDLIFREADADIVCCVDSHVLLGPGAIGALCSWFDAHPDSRDLLQGPMLYDTLNLAATHMEPTWGEGMYGQWGMDPRIEAPDCEPFEIAMQGLGVFACRRDAWPGLNPRLRGFGGEEGYLQEKFRQRGGRVLCHPRLTWAHRFQRPAGIPYPSSWEDRIRNYHLAWGEVGWDVTPVDEHFHDLLGPEVDVGGLLDRVRREVEHPLGVFDAVFCLAEDNGDCTNHPHSPGIAWRVERLSPDPALTGERRRLCGWRDALSAAARRGYQHVLLLEDPAGPAEALTAIDPSEWEREWDLCLLDGSAVAVNVRAYERILADLPPDESAASTFLARWGDLDAYLLHGVTRGALTAIGMPFAGPASDRPVRAPGLELVELACGLIVRQAEPPRVHELNNTAAMVLELCDGQRTVSQVAQVIADCFALTRPPLAEIYACAEGLRRSGILLPPSASTPGRHAGRITRHG